MSSLVIGMSKKKNITPEPTPPTPPPPPSPAPAGTPAKKKLTLDVEDISEVLEKKISP